ncbi:Transposase [Pseudomonas amygdali pv. ciccaronei]|nr:Transposase [Pseudomonas amygdali pv. ciccaronei]
MIHKNKLISVLSDAEQEALYGLPDFDDGQRLEFLSLSETELAFAGNRPSLSAQVYCFLQIGYFKAKHAFFRFDWNEVEDDCTFVLSRYFHGETFERKPITKHEHYTQREGVSELFGYRLWTADFLPQLGQQATQAARRDMTPGFVAAELIVWLNEHKIIGPATPPCKSWSAKHCPLNVGAWVACWRKCWTTRPKTRWPSFWYVMTPCLN